MITTDNALFTRISAIYDLGMQPDLRMCEKLADVPWPYLVTLVPKMLFIRYRYENKHFLMIGYVIEIIHRSCSKSS